MATSRNSRNDADDGDESDEAKRPGDTTSSAVFDPSLFDEFKILKFPDRTLLVCPFDSSSAENEPSPSSAVYTIKTTRQLKKGPDFSVSSYTASSSAEASTEALPILGVAYLSTRSATLGLGDPAVEVGDEAIVWEKMSNSGKWHHKVYSFEISLPTSTNSDGGSRRTYERRTFEWRRRKMLRMEMELVEVGKEKDESLVLAHYVRSPVLKRLKEKGVMAFRKAGGVEGKLWQVITILSALSLDEMKRRRD